MKKFVAVLLCLIMLLSLFSCKNKSIEDIDYISDNDSSTSLDTFNDPITNNASVNYDSLLRVYKRIVDSYPIVNQNPRALATELGIQGEENIEIFVNQPLNRFYAHALLTVAQKQRAALRVFVFFARSFFNMLGKSFAAGLIEINNTLFISFARYGK